MCKRLVHYISNFSQKPNVIVFNEEEEEEYDVLESTKTIEEKLPIPSGKHLTACINEANGEASKIKKTEDSCFAMVVAMQTNFSINEVTSGPSKKKLHKKRPMMVEAKDNGKSNQV